MKQIITKEQVHQAMMDLVGQGKKPTLAAIHAALKNRGSMSTLVRLKAEIDGEAQTATDSPEALKAFREIWALAVEEGRTLQESVLTELRDSLTALATENERLEGTTIAAQNLAREHDEAKALAEKEFLKYKDHAESEIKTLKTGLTEATRQLAEALRNLSATQADHAEQIKSLQAELTAANSLSHAIELKHVRAMAILESKGIHLKNT